MLIPNELVLTFGDCYLSVPLLVKIDQEMRPWECGQTQTGRQTDTRTDRDKLDNIYKLSHAICYRYGADNYFEFLFSFKTFLFFKVTTATSEWCDRQTGNNAKLTVSYVRTLWRHVGSGESRQLFTVTTSMGSYRIIELSTWNHSTAGPQ